MHILFITEVSPFPTNGGERMRCTGLLKAVSGLGHNVTAIIANEDKVNLENYSIKNVLFVDYDYQKRSTNNLTKSLNYFRKDKHLLSLIEQISKKHPVDIIFIDYFFLGQYISYFCKRNIPVIYGTHNVQSLLTLQDISGNLPNKFKKSLLYIIHYFHERLFFSKANVLIVVSDEDKQYYERFIKPDKIKIIPNFIDFKEYEVNIAKKNYLVISGNFYSFQNKIGTIWFVKNVWIKPLSGKTELLLAGKGSTELIEYLGKEMSLENIKATGTVDNIKSYIAGAKASIVPLLQGSGSRLKCIEAMALKTQLISTSLGAQGIEHQGSVLLADNALDFQKNILKVLKKQVDYTLKAFKISKEYYSLNAILVSLDKILISLFEDK